MTSPSKLPLIERLNQRLSHAEEMGGHTLVAFDQAEFADLIEEVKQLQNDKQLVCDALDVIRAEANNTMLDIQRVFRRAHFGITW